MRPHGPLVFLMACPGEREPVNDPLDPGSRATSAAPVLKTVSGAGGRGFTEASRGWTSWARFVQGHKIILGLGALGIMLPLGAPFLSMRQGTADYSAFIA